MTGRLFSERDNIPVSSKFDLGILHKKRLPVNQKPLTIFCGPERLAHPDYRQRLIIKKYRIDLQYRLMISVNGNRHLTSYPCTCNYKQGCQTNLTHGCETREDFPHCASPPRAIRTLIMGKTGICPVYLLNGLTSSVWSD